MRSVPALPAACAAYPTASRDDLALATPACPQPLACPVRGGRCFCRLVLPRCTRTRSQPGVSWWHRRAPRSSPSRIIPCAASLPDRTPRPHPDSPTSFARAQFSSKQVGNDAFRHVRTRRCAAATHHAPRACLLLTASPVLCRRREQPSAEPERIGTGGALDAGASLLRVLAATESTPGRRFFAEHRERRPGAQSASASALCICVSVLLAC